jgi:hypothetical protein
MARFMGYSGMRNLWKAFGYHEVITTDQYWKSYSRGGVGNRIIKSYPQACWRDGAIVADDDGAELDPEDKDFAPFAAAWDKLARDLNVIHYLERSDRLARVGQYGICVMGFADNLTLSEEMTGTAELRYMSPYAERSVTITQWDTDSDSERFGQPVLYRVQPSLANDSGTSQSVPNSSFVVHYTRVIHITENSDDSDVFGEPALRPVWNYLLDLEKLVGSSVETFWLNARGGMSIEAAADAKISPEGVAAMKKQAEEYENQLRRVIAIQGAKVQMLATSVASPQYNSELLFSLISGTTGIPQRVLFGSERGELASSEDANSWESRIDERRKNHCGPTILHAFITRMIETGNLPASAGEWYIEWPEASAASPEKQADVAVKRATAVATYANSSADQIVGPSEFRLWLGLEAEADAGVLDEPDDADTLGIELPEDPDEEEEDTQEVAEDPESEEDEADDM